MPTTLPSHDDDRRWRSFIALVAFSMALGIGLLTLDRALRTRNPPPPAEAGSHSL